MMKRVIALLLVFIFASSVMVMPCRATPQEDGEIVYLEDGSYLLITTTSFTVSRSSNTIGCRRSVNRYSSDDVLQWTYTLEGIFRYTPGVEAVCTSATCSVDIINTKWTCSSKSATTSGATAIGEATMIYKILFITTTTVPVNLTITCDTYGNFS